MNIITKIDNNIKYNNLDILHDKPIVVTINEFDEETCKKVSKDFAAAHLTGQQHIPVIINTFGGQVYNLLALISLFKSSKLPIITIVQGKAMSCGAVLAAFGTKGMRFAAPESTFMVHQVSMGDFGKIEDVKVSVEEGQRLSNKIFSMMSLVCGHPYDFFTNKLKNRSANTDWFLEPKEALELGIIDHVKVPTLQLEVSIDWEIV